MSAALRTAAEAATLPTVPGCSDRAMRVVLCRTAQLAQQDGSLRYGLRVSKLATLVHYSPATVKRAQAALVAAGFLERVQVGGGRASTRWRVLTAALGIRPTENCRPVDNRPPGPTPRAGTSPSLGRQPVRREPGQEHPPRFSSWMNDGELPLNKQAEPCKHGEPRGHAFCAFCRHGIEPRDVTQLPRVLTRRRRR
jgi:hypothetical protein